MPVIFENPYKIPKRRGTKRARSRLDSRAADSTLYMIGGVGTGGSGARFGSFAQQMEEIEDEPGDRVTVYVEDKYGDEVEKRIPKRTAVRNLLREITEEWDEEEDAAVLKNPYGYHVVLDDDRAETVFWDEQSGQFFIGTPAQYARWRGPV